MLKGRFLSAKRSVSFEATQNKHCTWKGCEFAEKFHKIGIFCRPFWLLRERKKFRVTRTGILRQLRWLRVASTIVLTTGQNQRYYIPLPCLRMELSGDRTQWVRFNIRIAKKETIRMDGFFFW